MMKRLLAALALLPLVLAGCDVSPDVVAQHLVADGPCLAAAASVAAQVSASGAAAAFGLPAGAVTAVSVVAALANGKMTQVPLDLFTACQGLLANVKADVDSIKAKVQKPKSDSGVRDQALYDRNVPLSLGDTRDASGGGTKGGVIKKLAS